MLHELGYRVRSTSRFSRMWRELYLLGFVIYALILFPMNLTVMGKQCHIRAHLLPNEEAFVWGVCANMMIVWDHRNNRENGFRINDTKPIFSLFSDWPNCPIWLLEKVFIWSGIQGNECKCNPCIVDNGVEEVLYFSKLNVIVELYLKNVWRNIRVISILTKLK